MATENNQVVLKVRVDSTKSEIRQAVELLFPVKVSSVNVIKYHGKIKRHGRTSGRRAAWKKAYVTLSEGSALDLLGTE
jgi:large subunit ribosomal protein L23